MKLLYVFIPLLLQCLLLPPYASAKDSTLNILYTGSLNGQLEPCGCSPKSDFGGIQRIAGYIGEHRDELGPYIIIDAGNFSGTDTPQGKLKTGAMIKAMGIIGYNAVAVSENEQLFSADFIGTLLKENRLPAVSGQPAYDSSIVIEKDGFGINVSADPGGLMEGKLNILLISIPVSGAKLFEGWDVIISSAGEEIEEPLTINNAVVLSGYPKGKKLGVLSVVKNNEGTVIFSHEWQQVSNDLPEDKAVRDVLNDYDKKVVELMQEAERPPVGATYTGVENCVECHQIFYEQWQETRHVHAFASLQEAGKSADPECVVCHVVGYGEKGGFFTIETTPGLANVQCEACHGLNRDHLTDFSPMSPVTEQTCLKCHTNENSPEFDYPVYLEKIKH